MSAPSQAARANETLLGVQARNGLTPSNVLMWRLGLSRAALVPTLPDQLHLAQLCLDAGLADVSRMVYQAACLPLGFASEWPSKNEEFSAALNAANLWQPAPRKTDKPDLRGTVERAVDDLRAFARDHAGNLAARLTLVTDVKSNIAPVTRSSADLPASLPLILEDLFTFLRAEWSEAAGEKAEARLAQLRSLIGIEPFDWRSFATAPLSLLTEATVLASMQDFACRNSFLMLEAKASAALLHAAARFDAFGLGPYFTNVPRIARGSRDIFELAQIAHAAQGASVTREHWVVLLSGRLPDSMRDEVVDDLGDIGATAALALMLDQAMKQPSHRIDNTLITRIRDAALDNADYELAAKAQTVSVRLYPDRLLERRLLGEIQATAGLTRVAEQLFVECLEQAPDDPIVHERLAALRAGTFSEFHVLGGFGTPPDRLQTRRLRRQHAAR